MQTVTIKIDTDTWVQSYGVVYAGEYTIECPAYYDPSEIDAEDMVLDCSITVLD